MPSRLSAWIALGVALVLTIVTCRPATADPNVQLLGTDDGIQNCDAFFGFLTRLYIGGPTVSGATSTSDTQRRDRRHTGFHANFGAY